MPVPEVTSRLWRMLCGGNLSAAVLLAVLVGGAGMAAERPTSAPAGAVRVERYTWHDVDTPVDVVVRLPWGVLLEERRGIRDAGFDGWEVGDRPGSVVTAEERARGRKALEEIRLLSVGRSLWVVPVGRGTRDSFGRLLGRLYLERAGEWIEVRAWAEANGHVRTAPKTP